MRGLLTDGPAIAGMRNKDLFILVLVLVAVLYAAVYFIVQSSIDLSNKMAGITVTP